ncbi:MAG: hypothetical protein KC940_02805, partial [Candidatus Omnitrophica bacterium]|nr:hypothetical protein [Candidatus Omnitrophota bacterium]
MTDGDSPEASSPHPQTSTPSIGRGAVTMFLGRGVTLVFSLAGLLLFPALLGPEAHGWFQYYLSLQLFLLGFLNGCAAPITAHYVALYRVSDPPRQGILLKQVFRWFLVLFLGVAAIRFLLPDPRGYWWIYVSVGFSGCSQMLASALYGLGRLGTITWFPVLSLIMRMTLICGFGWWVSQTLSLEEMGAWGTRMVPPLLVLSTLPAWFWMVGSFLKNSNNWFIPDPKSEVRAAHAFPWEEIRDFGFAALLGQILFQSFTRSLPVLAGQMGYPAAHLGYLGLSTQAFGQTIFIAGFFSVALYPWLVSAGGEKDWDRFSRLQSVAWRLSAFLGGWLVVGTLVLIYPAV